MEESSALGFEIAAVHLVPTRGQASPSQMLVPVIRGASINAQTLPKEKGKRDGNVAAKLRTFGELAGEGGR